MKLDYIPPKGEVVDFSNRKLPTLMEIWGPCLVGCFTGRFPGMKAVHALINKWGVRCKAKSHDRGWVIFHFQSEDDRTKVISEGPYSSYGKALFLKMLSEDFEFDGEEFLKVPTWIKFPGLSVTLWNKPEISELASRVGVPIIADQITQNKARAQFARVLVEVDSSKPPVLEIPMIQPSGKRRKQFVVFETYPNYCYECKKFGHNPFVCKVLHPEKKGNGDKHIVIAKEMENPKKDEAAKNKTVAIVEPEEPPFKLVVPRKWTVKHKEVKASSSNTQAAKEPKTAKKKNKEPATSTGAEPSAKAAPISPFSAAVPNATKLKEIEPAKADSTPREMEKETVLQPANPTDIETAETSSRTSKPKEPTYPFILKIDRETREFVDGIQVPDKDIGGNIVRSIYEMDDEDVVTKWELDEKGKRTVYVMKRADLPLSHFECRVGPNFKAVYGKENPGMSFTFQCLKTLPGAKRHFNWFKFEPSIFIPNVVSFFDENSNENKTYYKEMLRRKAREEKKKLAGSEDCQTSNLDGHG
ncbi:unnamed protein product [Cuscuta epithymum]|uniref:DUF4283 domain-containing protein n=1 Tax=Cuscuta epithymum TaxID=186058 RepID=A0AAV0F2I9_9ASTE|nr:unnamed protein product [Cuscuta epithymum]